MVLKETGTRGAAPDRDAALRKYRAAVDNFDLGVEHLRDVHWEIRERSIRELHLQEGDTVLDVGCGTGLSFPLLVEAVGAHGRVIGIDQSPEMLTRARILIARHQWLNVTLVSAPAAEAKIPAPADAALFHYTHDIMREPAALENIIAQLKPGAHIVAVGMKWAQWWNVPINLTVLRRARRFITTFDGLRAPWSHLKDLATDFRCEPLLGGGAYIACARKPYVKAPQD